MLEQLQNSNLFSRKAKEQTFLITGLSRCYHWFQKSLKKLSHDQVNEVLSDDKILRSCHFESRSNHSTNLYLSFSTDKLLKRFWWRITNWNDFAWCRKSFWDSFLVRCMEWFLIFFIEPENQLSYYGMILCSAPQVSILGPMMFLIYLNDLP